MADLGDLYDRVRRDISELVGSLDEARLDERVPATPEWSIKDVVAHLTGVAEGALSGNFPEEFLTAYGRPSGVRTLNLWTADHVTGRKNEDLDTILDEWAKHAEAVVPVINGEAPMPENAPPFAERVLLTDAAVHQQDLYGALGIQRGREGAPVKVGSSSYVGVMDMRLRQAGNGVLGLEAGEKRWTVGGDGEPGGTVRASRFEFFRALSGRRSPEQIRSYDWTIDPEPYIEFFYPYGIREEALEE